MINDVEHSKKRLLCKKILTTLEVINKFNKVVGYKINTWKTITLAMNNLKIKLRKQYIYSNIKRNKTCRKFNKKVQNLYSKLKTLKKLNNKWKDIPFYGLEHLILLSWQYSPNWSMDLCTTHQNSSCLLCRNWQADPKFHIEIKETPE